MADEPKREFRASARNVRMSARKARLVMDAVRGRDADEAMVVLQYVNKRAAPAIRKLIESAMANAEEYGNRQGVDIDTGELVIATAYADEGPRMKRWRPRSRGMANPFTRYTCHMHVVLAERTWLDEKSKGRPAFAKPRQRVSRVDRLAKKGIVVAADSAKAEKSTAKSADKASKADKKPAGKTDKAEKAEKKPVKKAAPKSDKKTATKKKK